MVLVDLDKLERNVYTIANKVRSKGKILWPMFKTTKSTFIARLQEKAGAEGFLCGSVAEAETLVNKGITNTVMLAYPTVDSGELDRIANLIERDVRVIIRIDNVRLASLIDRSFHSKGLKIEYCIKVDVGYQRLGVRPENVGSFAWKLRRFSSLEFTGIVTHQGNAYSARNPLEVRHIAKRSAELMEVTLKFLKRYGLEPEIVGAGSTPTLRFDIEEPIYTHLFPGNYVYYDRTQALVYGSAKIEDCALTVLATIISVPEHSSGNVAVINAGGRYFDKEIRGGLKGYGQLVEYPKVVVSRVSQEIALLDTSMEKVEVGEKVNIITNHSCYTNNAVNILIGHRNRRVTNIIPIDAKEDIDIEKRLLSINIFKRR